MCGLIGVVYELIVIRTARMQKDYRAVFEDWLWHCALPLISYAVLFVSGVTLYRHPTTSLFVIGACAVLLLITGIHNAWDSVTYLASQRVEKVGD
jgi:hypothetical protein